MLSLRKILLLTFILLLSFSTVYAATESGTNIGNYATLQAFSGNYSTDSNSVNNIVAIIRGIDINTNSSQTVLPSGNAYFAKNLTNVGNIAENIYLTLPPATAGWTASLVVDDNNDGVHQAGETTPVPSPVNVGAGTVYKFFVKMTAPPSYNLTGTVNLTCSANNSSVGSYTGNNNISYGGPMLVSAENTASTVVSPAGNDPVFSDIKFDGVLVRSKDYIGKTPLITAKILDIDGIVTASIKLTIDGAVVTQGQGISWDGTYMSYRITSELGKGTHTFIFEAKDPQGNIGTRTIKGKITEKVKIVGRVLPYPNPYNPDEGDAKITYQLTNEAKVTIYIYSITGERIWMTKIDEGEEGGHSGYNEVLWDGKNGFYEQVGNGVYIAHIVDSKGRTLAKTKILVIR